jgi:hypothetical protein
MTVTPPAGLVDSIQDSINAKLKRGVGLEAAVAEFAQWYTEPVQRAALAEAANRIRKSVSEIERLRHPTTLKGKNHVAWYPGPHDTDTYWPALKTYLHDIKRRDKDVIDSIDTSSTKVVSCLDFPGSATFSTRGLVVGYVQSGKTANFTAVISKAADAGFRVFLVLSGLTNSLRKQTQERLSAELVTLLPAHWQTWTDLERDFGDYPFSIDALLNNDQRHLAVVKKNGPRLRRLLRMINKASPQILAQCPVMIIDDECDQASVNASGRQDRLTAINRLLRDFLGALPRVSYVGYTATPYANVLIDPSYEEDLYPRDFIVSLPKPPSYFGAERLFGRDLLDADPVPPEDSGLDMIRDIPETDATLLRPASREGKDDFYLSITPALRDAIRYFLLATAAKVARGLGDDHSSMLIHTTVYARPHHNAKPIIEKFVDALLSAVDSNDKETLAELRDQWNKEMTRMPSDLVGCKPVSFDALLPHLRDSANRPTVVVENSESDKRLDFSIPARRYIVIGGNVLARGLTIDGLVVSFFLRTAGQYDTLMQMGRWFGYRAGYEDLPRIWMTNTMADYFKDMATVEAEIRYDIEVYERERLTPLQFAIRIRQLPGLEITAKKKMIDAVDCDVSFAGEHPQTRRFLEKNADFLTNNWDAASTLIDKHVSKAGPGRGSAAVFAGVPFTDVIGFLRDYRLHPSHQQFATDRLIDYVTRQNGQSHGSLATWNVAVLKGDGGPSERPLGGLGVIDTVSRARLKYGGDADIKALMSKSDVLVDLPAVQIAAGIGWSEVKALRDAQTGARTPLLLLYPICRKSKAQARSQKDREDMDAVHDILGMAIVFPTPAGKPVVLGYKRARIDPYLDEEPEYTEETLRDDDVGA